MADINDSYQQAPELAQHGECVVSTDELAGVHALERKHEGLPMQLGKVERWGFEYIHHGTQSFISVLTCPSARSWQLTVETRLM